MLISSPSQRRNTSSEKLSPPAKRRNIILYKKAHNWTDFILQSDWRNRNDRWNRFVWHRANGCRLDFRKLGCILQELSPSEAMNRRGINCFIMLTTSLTLTWISSSPTSESLFITKSGKHALVDRSDRKEITNRLPVSDDSTRFIPINTLEQEMTSNARTAPSAIYHLEWGRIREILKSVWMTADDDERHSIENENVCRWENGGDE